MKIKCISLYAIECHNKECLQFILEELCEVDIPEAEDIENAGSKCSEYLINLYKQ